jgi:hypothetical protein
MRRTVELKIEVADDDAYADAIAAIHQAVERHGSVQDIRFTRASMAIGERIQQTVPGFVLRQYSGSVHDDR